MSITLKCKVEGCDWLGQLNSNGKRYFPLGYCIVHYTRLRVSGSLGAEKKRWKHKMTNHPLYTTWEGMQKRCNSPKSPHYGYYGGRGIKVCSRWDNFANFVEDMGDKPDGYTLERVDNNKGYSPDNCKWANRREQAINTRVRRDNMSGTRGVSFNKNAMKYEAYIKLPSGRIHLGLYEDYREATEARKEAEIKYWGQFKTPSKEALKD